MTTIIQRQHYWAEDSTVCAPHKRMSISEAQDLLRTYADECIYTASDALAGSMARLIGDLVPAIRAARSHALRVAA